MRALDDKLAALAERKQALVQQSRSGREALADGLAPLGSVLARVDSISAWSRQMSQTLRTSEATWLLLPVAVLALVRPRKSFRLTRRALTAGFAWYKLRKRALSLLG